MGKRLLACITAIGLVYGGVSMADTPTPSPTPTSDILKQIYQQLQVLTGSVNKVGTDVQTSDTKQSDNWKDYFDKLHSDKFESATKDGSSLLLTDSGYTTVSHLNNLQPMGPKSAQALNALYFCNYAGNNFHGACKSDKFSGYHVYNLVGPLSYDQGQDQSASSYITNMLTPVLNPSFFQSNQFTNSNAASLYQYQGISVISHVLNDIKLSRTPLDKDTPSEMEVLKQATTAPLAGDWIKQVGVASNQQVLRSMAIMLAVNNYIQYKRLEQEQNTQVLQAAQLQMLLAQQSLLDKIQVDLSAASSGQSSGNGN